MPSKISASLVFYNYEQHIAVASDMKAKSPCHVGLEITPTLESAVGSGR